VNNELLRFASPSAEGLIRIDMARVAALKADTAMLEGTGGTQIKGLLTYSDIATLTAGAPDTDGDTFQAEDVARMNAKLPDAVAAPTAWVMRKEMHAALMSRRADATTAADAAGPFLFQPMRMIGDAPPMELYGTKVVRSGQVSNARTKGGGSDLTYILLGYFPDWRVKAKRKTSVSRENRPKPLSTLSTIWGGFGPNPRHSVHDSVQPIHVRPWHSRRGGSGTCFHAFARTLQSNRRLERANDRCASFTRSNDSPSCSPSRRRRSTLHPTDRQTRVR
jgi:hypothetical protein